MKNLVILFFVIILSGCNKFPDIPQVNYSIGGGAYIINEGNLSSGNGEISFYSFDSLKVFNDLFYAANGRPLGDVPNSAFSYGDKLFVVVNNSGKIEELNLRTLESEKTISGLISPRNMVVINNYKGYVTSLYSDSLTIINPSTGSITGYIDLGGTSESIVSAGNKAYVTRWWNGNKVMVIDILNNMLVDSIEVGNEPEGLVVDRQYGLWVLCPGGWQKETPAELDRINIFNDEVEKRYLFPSVMNSPSCLRIDSWGQTLYYLDNGVRKMDINSPGLPSEAFIQQGNNEYFNKFEINPVNDDVFISDAADFRDRGNLLIYNNIGEFVSKHRVGIIPGFISFNLTIE
jgi:hypothetical protein